MGDFDLNIIAGDFNKSLEELSVEVEKEVHGAVRDIAHAAYGGIITSLQSQTLDPKGRKAYLDGLSISRVPDGFVIALEGSWALNIEDGSSSPTDMRDTLLKSTSRVSKGSRAGEPWVRVSKKGHKYAAVPFRKQPFAKDVGITTSDLSSALKKLTAVNMKGRRQRLTRIFRDELGKPLTGRVATAELTSHNVGVDFWNPDPETNEYLRGLAKYQSIAPKTGAVHSQFIVFRMISEGVRDGSWMRKASEGLGLFKDAEKFVGEALDQIVHTLL